MDGKYIEMLVASQKSNDEDHRDMRECCSKNLHTLKKYFLVSARLRGRKKQTKIFRPVLKSF
jgi:hypothetical protein